MLYKQRVYCFSVTADIVDNPSQFQLELSSS
jgi:hypothetical protein